MISTRQAQSSAPPRPGRPNRLRSARLAGQIGKAQLGVISIVVISIVVISIVVINNISRGRAREKKGQARNLEIFDFRYFSVYFSVYFCIPFVARFRPNSSPWLKWEK